jgi:hypothetical protein
VPTPSDKALEGRRIRTRANQVARCEAAVWLCLQGIGLNDRLLVLNEVLSECLAKAREAEAQDRL